MRSNTCSTHEGFADQHLDQQTPNPSICCLQSAVFNVSTQPLPSPNVCVADQACSNGLYAAYRAELEHELHSMFGPDWRSENGLTPSQELAAWDRDGDRINRAAEVVAYRHRMVEAT